MKTARSRPGKDEYSPVESKPCDRCKRAIINAGIREVVTRGADGGVRTDVSEWVREDTEYYTRLMNLLKKNHLIQKR